MRRPRPILLAHGGAGLRRLSRPQSACLAGALETGYDVLKQGGPALDAVETAIKALEASGLFNAGLGSRRQLDGVARMDASLMEGRELRAGAVASIEDVLHPIAAARLVMTHTEHVLLAGSHATRLAKFYELDLRPKEPRRRVRRAIAKAGQMLRLHRAMVRSGRRGRERHGRETVGAVALDRTGTVAAGASTGGIDVMLPGRVGDTPLIGCGVYADDRGGAVSLTGWGESIIRAAAAKGIVDSLAVGAGPSAAARGLFKVLIERIRGAAGALVLAPDGRFAIVHTTPRMAAGYWDGAGRPTVGDRFR